MGKFLGCTGFPKCRNIKNLPGEATDEACDKCGRPMALKRGRFGPFLGCTGYPECRNIKRTAGNKDGSEAPSGEATDETCAECGRPMMMKRGRYGPFLSCSGYPECRSRKKAEKQEEEPVLVGAED